MILFLVRGKGAYQRLFFIIFLVVLSVPSSDVVLADERSSASTSVELYHEEVGLASGVEKVSCSALIESLESRLLYSPEDSSLQAAFVKAVESCQISAEDPFENTVQQEQSYLDFNLRYGLGQHSNPELISSFDKVNLLLDNQVLSLTNADTAISKRYQELGFSSKWQSSEDTLAIDLSARSYSDGNEFEIKSAAVQYHFLSTEALWSVLFNQFESFERKSGVGQIRWVTGLTDDVLVSMMLGRTWYPQDKLLEGLLFETTLSRRFLSKANIELAVLGRIQQNAPFGDRAGGRQTRVGLDLALGKSYQASHYGLGYSHYYAVDDEPYSPLLEKKPVRNLINSSAYIKWRYHGFEWGELSMRYEHVQQASNIDLFDWQYQRFDISLQKNW